MAKMVKCSKCGEMKDSRGISKHLQSCKGTLEADEKKEIDKKESVLKCIACDSKVICRLDEFVEKAKSLGTVNVNQNALKKMYKDGYTHVCGDCGEVLK
jgi:predicted lactoylglutathione lyase